MALSECIEIAKNIILSGSAMTGAVVAVKGLNAWKRQLEHKFSQDILMSLFEYRRSIDETRNRTIWPHERVSPSKEKAEKMSEKEISYYAVSKAYETRWNKVNDKRAKLNVCLLEAEAAWDDDLNERFKVLFDFEQKLSMAIREYFDLINHESGTSSRTVEGEGNNFKSILYENRSKEGDKYKNAFNAEVEKIKKYVKRKHM